jgi:hypothetical protein
MSYCFLFIKTKTSPLVDNACQEENNKEKKVFYILGLVWWIGDGLTGIYRVLKMKLSLKEWDG